MATRELQAPSEDAPEWVKRAWLRIQDGETFRAAAAAEGKHHASLRRWVIVGERERVAEKTARWFKDNPERTRELGRKNQKKRRQTKGDEMRRYSREYNRRPERRAVCTSCGALRGIDSAEDPPGRCMACVEREFRELGNTVVKLWAEGLKIREIAERIGRSSDSMSPLMDKLRRRGYDLPYRNARPS